MSDVNEEAMKMNNVTRPVRQLFEPGKGAFLAGMTLAIPFVAELFPSSYVRHLSLLIAIPFFIHMARFGVRVRNEGGIPYIVWATLIVALVHVYGLWTGPTQYWKNVLRDVVMATSIVSVFLVARKRSEPGDVLRGFFAAVVLFALFAATLGLVKAALVERGILLSFLYSIDPGLYPPGSCWQRDYNLFGLSLLVAGVGLVARQFKTNNCNRDIVIYSIGLVLILAAGICAGSRRFLIFSVVIPISWLTIGAFSIPRPQIAKKLLLPMAGVACAVGMIFWIIQSSTPFEYYKIFSISDLGRSIFETLETKGKESDRSAVTVMETNPKLILGTMNQEHAYGFDTRLGRWKLGTDLLIEKAWLIGMGFSYHEAFAYRFVEEDNLDYPHFPILSEWLIGGIVGGIAAIAVYFLLFQSVWNAGRGGWISGSSAIVIAVVPYSLLSGDTLFSIPQFLIVCLLAQIYTAPGRNAVQNAEVH